MDTRILLFLFLIFGACIPTRQQTCQTYKIGKMLRGQNFDSLSRVEDFLVKIRPEDNALNGEGAFYYNRGRLFLDAWYKDEQKQALDTIEETGLPLPCNCYLKKDTIILQAALGTTMGLGLKIKLQGKRFSSYFYVYNSEIPIYKADDTEGDFGHALFLENPKAKLLLQEKPKFELGELLRGHLSYSTATFYEKLSQNDSTSRNHIKGELLFSCRLREKMLWEE